MLLLFHMQICVLPLLCTYSPCNPLSPVTTSLVFLHICLSSVSWMASGRVHWHWYHHSDSLGVLLVVRSDLFNRRMSLILPLCPNNRSFLFWCYLQLWVLFGVVGGKSVCSLQIHTGACTLMWHSRRSWEVSRPQGREGKGRGLGLDVSVSRCTKVSSQLVRPTSRCRYLSRG